MAPKMPKSALGNGLLNSQHGRWRSKRNHFPKLPHPTTADILPVVESEHANSKDVSSLHACAGILGQVL
jgi:hypothetical protein